MVLTEALQIAQRVKALLTPHCTRIEIAGSIRRNKPQVKDIELVAIAKPWQTGLFMDGLAAAVNPWEKIRGDIENNSACKYTQRLLPEGIKLDLFLCDPVNWGYIYAIRTGPAEFNQYVLLPALKKRGYVPADGVLKWHGKIQPVREEHQLFQYACLPYYEPQNRTYNHLPIKS